MSDEKEDDGWISPSHVQFSQHYLVRFMWALTHITTIIGRKPEAIVPVYEKEGTDRRDHMWASFEKGMLRVIVTMTDEEIVIRPSVTQDTDEAGKRYNRDMAEQAARWCDEISGYARRFNKSKH